MTSTTHKQRQNQGQNQGQDLGRGRGQDQGQDRGQKQGQLHLHTPFSDGEITLDLLLAAPYDFVAISDHDTMEGISTYGQLEQITGIEVIPAVEITCQFEGKKLHVLSYWPDQSSQEFKGALAKFRYDRSTRTQETISLLSQNGFDISMDDFSKYGKLIVKNNIAHEVYQKPKNRARLEKEGITSESAFKKTYLTPGSKVYPELKRPDATKILPLSKGVLVLAHPGRNLKLGAEDYLVKKLIDQIGIVGVESGSRHHAPEQNVHYYNLARSLGLITVQSGDVHRTDQINSNIETYSALAKLKRAKEVSRRGTTPYAPSNNYAAQNSLACTAEGLF